MQLMTVKYTLQIESFPKQIIHKSLSKFICTFSRTPSNIHIFQDYVCTLNLKEVIHYGATSLNIFFTISKMLCLDYSDKVQDIIFIFFKLV